MTELGDDTRGIGLQLCAVLDPLMMFYGFQSRQPGASTSEVGVVYSSAYVDFRARFPDLAPDIDDTRDTACADLNVDVQLGSAPHLHDVRLEGHHLGELLRDVDREDLMPDLRSLPDLDVAEGAQRLRKVLTAIFVAASRSAATGGEGSTLMG